jgi:hypothetical protein
VSGHRSTILAISALFAFFFTINCAVYLCKSIQLLKVEIELLGTFTEQLIFNIANIQNGQERFAYLMPTIIVVEGLMLIPLCRVLNFQKFRILTIPIVITVILLFVFLIANLIVRITYKLNSDFCTIMEDGKTIPSAEFGISSATVVPTLSYAFGFQIYMLQVHKVLDRPDPNGYRGMKIGLSTLTIMLAIYGGLLLLTVAYQEPHDK